MRHYLLAVSVLLLGASPAPGQALPQLDGTLVNYSSRDKLQPPTQHPHDPPQAGRKFLILAHSAQASSIRSDSQPNPLS